MKNREMNFLVFAAVFAACAHVHAAPITWGTTATVSTGVGNSSDVSLNGTLVEAFNAQAAGEAGINTTSPVVNGVTFVNTTTLLPSLLGTGDPDMFTATNGGDASYDALLSDAEFGGGGDLITISLGGGALTPGSAYELQVWFVDDRAAENGRVMQYGDGNGDTVNLNDKYAIGTFTADGISQDFTLDAQDFGNAHITAYQIRQISSTITWGTPMNVSTGAGNSSDVSTNGTLLEAYNAQAAGEAGINTTNPVVNGVTFVNTTTLLPSLLGAGDPEMSTATNGGDASYDALLSDAEFGGGDSTLITLGDGDGDTSVTGAGLLQVGELYEIQVWFVDDRAEADYDSRTMGFGSVSSGPIANLNDQYVIGNFTAEGSTVSLFLDTVSPASGFGHAHITAYQIRHIPTDIKVVSTEFVSGTGFQITFSGLDTGTTYELRRSDDLQAPWTPVAGSAKMPAASTDTFADTTATLPGPSFYQLWVLP